MVPVVQERRSLGASSRSRARSSGSARTRSRQRLKPEDLRGRTFTITSLGQQGGLFATPIINFPEVAILGVHQMKQKPVVRDGQIVIGDVMLLSLSFDHRLIDGHVGAAFAYDIIGFSSSQRPCFSTWSDVPRPPSRSLFVRLDGMGTEERR